MPRQTAIVVENDFTNGLVTEASGLNFPEKAVTETDNCEFEIDGSVFRRSGFDFEPNYATKTINRDGKVVTSYLWQNVAGNGDVTVVVTQIGNTLYFYETTGTGNFSQGAQTTTVTLTGVSGAPLVETIEAQYSDGNGFLFVTHPYINPLRISYDIDSHTATPVSLNLKIRDFEGATADPYAVDFRPTATLAALDISHKYNLYNQGWTTVNLTTWDTNQTTMPSNADVMWRFVNSTNDFDASSASIARINSGNTPAPKGHYVLNLANQDRATASGIVGVAGTTTSFQRPSTSAFFAGRMFYSGVNYVGFNSNIYFSQIIERVDQYEQCYQVNDPTSEDLFDLLPSDGGVISIPEAGTIYKLYTVPGGLCAFCANGVWFITGSTGLGFTATDYTVQKIAKINTLSASSFVDVAGFPAWWNAEGIYLMQAGQTFPTISSLTYNKINDFFTSIPLSSKRFARGYYNPTSGHIRWIYRSTQTNQINQIYEFDRILNLHTRTGAWYPWTVAEGSPKINSIIATELITKPVTVMNVVDSHGNNVVDSLGNQVISFSSSGSQDLQLDKYLVSYPESSSYKFTFADRNNEEYVDWFKYDNLGKNYESYFITGFKLRGQAIRKFQSNWVRIFSRLIDPVRYYFQGIWDFAGSGDTGRWSVSQLVEHDEQNYSNSSRRLKVRGNGLSMQFKVSSVDGHPFDIIGWSSVQSTNGAP